MKRVVPSTHTSLVFSVWLCQWSSVMSCVVLEKERMLPVLLELLDTNNDVELRPLTGLLRNLARHSSNKDLMGETRGKGNVYRDTFA